MATPRNGFVASRTLTGKNPVLRMFKVKVDATNAYFQGDPVALDANGFAVIVTAAVSANYLGVIHSLYGDPGNDFDPPRALTFNQPTRGPYLVTGASGFALVNVDTEQLYVVQLDVTASSGLIGATVHVSAGAPNTAAGISGFCLKGSTIGTDAERPFKIVGIAPGEQTTGRGDKAAGSGVEVKLNSSIFSVTTGV